MMARSIHILGLAAFAVAFIAVVTQTINIIFKLVE